MNILHSSKDGRNICYSLWNIAKTSSQILIKIIFRMVTMATSMTRKINTCQKHIIWISGYYFMMLWKGYQNFYFFTKFGRHIWSDTPAHWGWNTLSQHSISNPHTEITIRNVIYIEAMIPLPCWQGGHNQACLCYSNAFYPGPLFTNMD